MLIIGEKINISRSEIAGAVRSRNASAILKIAKAQLEAGADVIDVNAGDPDRDKAGKIADMVWAVESLRGKIESPLAVDSDDVAVLEAGLEAAKSMKPWINSVSAESARLDKTLDVAKGGDYPIIALCVGDDGMPKDVDQRLGYAEKILGAGAKRGIATERFYFDPVVVPVGVEVEAGMMILHAIRKIKTTFPGANTVVGLSNISFGLPSRGTMNGAFLALCMGAGLDAAIMDPTKTEVMSIFRAADAIMGGDEYCSNFLRHFRECKGRES